MSNVRNFRDISPFVFSHWEYFGHLKSHKQFIIVFTLSATLCALALTYIYSEKYEASTTLVFSPEEVIRLKIKTQETEAFGAPMPGADFKVIGKTLEGLVKSERLLRDVVAELELDKSAEKVYSGPWYIRYYEMFKDYGKEYAVKTWNFLKYGRLTEEDPTVTAVLELASEVQLIAQDSYVFRLTVRDKHPLRAAAIADTLAKSLEKMLEERDRDPASNRIEKLEVLLANKILEIQSYQKQIDDLLAANNLTSVEEEIQRGLEQLFELTTQKLLIEADIVKSERELAALEEKLALKGRAGGESGAAGSFGGNNSYVQEPIRPDDFNKMATDKLDTEVELAGQRARYNSLLKSIRKLEAVLRRLPELQLTIKQLQTSLARANDDYAMINVALQEQKVSEIDAISELKIQHPATPPTAPVSPIKVYHVSLAAMLGLFFAIGLAYLFAFFNIRIFVPSKGVKARQNRFPDSDDSHPGTDTTTGDARSS